MGKRKENKRERKRDGGENIKRAFTEKGGEL